MGPGLIAGLAGNDAGGIATYSVLGAETGLSLLWILPDHDGHARRGARDGGPHGRRLRARAWAT